MATTKKHIPIHQQLDSVTKMEQSLAIRKDILLNKAFHSTHPTDIIKANTIIGVEQREKSDKKSYLIDPYEFNNSMGFKDKPFSLSYQILKRMSYTVPIIRAIIGTRIDQIASFCEPQSDKYSTGFIIRKKQKYFDTKGQTEPSEQELNRIEEITNFVLNCGTDNNFEADDFDTFVRKIINDSLSYDQMCFEIVTDRKGRPCSFYAVDASTIRIADSYDDDEYQAKERTQKFGYYPSYCQIRDNIVTADFYPWEMCFGVRNPTTNIYSNGYGVSEIEILVNTITSMLWSDEYNRRFFSQGSAPKGFFKIKQGVAMNDARLNQFKQQWQAMMAGVYNSWKTPVLEGDIDWVDLQKNNRDMEFAKWQEYLIKLACAIYKIDPAEINFPLSGSSDAKPMFEGNNEARLKHSKDKGLFPMLKFLQRKINKYLVSRFDPAYEFVFTGMEGLSLSDELEMDIKMMANFMTIDEIRVKRGLKPLGDEKGGNIIGNSIWMQKQNADAMAKQQQEQGGMGENGNPNAEEGNGEESDQEFDTNDEQSYEENPFEKAFENYLTNLN